VLVVVAMAACAGAQVEQAADLARGQWDELAPPGPVVRQLERARLLPDSIAP